MNSKRWGGCSALEGRESYLWEAKTERFQLWPQSILAQVSWKIPEKETQLNRGLEILWGSTSMNPISIHGA